jgi:8-oxo-dGTP pyrophosphatase MutT (NUDIX family)
MKFREFINERKNIILDFKIYEALYWGNAAAGILPFCSETKRFLIGLRSSDVYEPNTYGTFGGKLDTDEITEETIQEAALRELEEETEFSGEMDLIKGYVFKDTNFEYHNYIGVVKYEFEPILNWENDEADWITYKELLNIKPKHPGLKLFLTKSKNIFERLVY